jgi:cell division septal protein FtsQ
MMHQLIGKKYLIYIFFFIILTTFNNINLSKLEIFKIKEIDIIDQDVKIDNSVIQNLKEKLKIFKNENIFFIDKKKIASQISKNGWISNFSIKKKYPSKLIINFKKAKLIANISIANEIYYLGSNFKLIKSETHFENLPNISGNPKLADLKIFIEKLQLSKLNYQTISYIDYIKSGRWNIKTDKNITIKLPDNNVIKYLNFANEILENEEIIIKNTINLTVKDQMIIN